ncbi:hypothetical protein ABFS83_03G092900 [Erythranthe nasuta]
MFAEHTLITNLKFSRCSTRNKKVNLSKHLSGGVEEGNKMMAEDLGLEANEAAVREAANLLPLPELIQSIASIKTDFVAR